VSRVEAGHRAAEWLGQEGIQYRRGRRRGREIDCVLIGKFDRFARSTCHLLATALP
jgi:hypothetical protein